MLPQPPDVGFLQLAGLDEKSGDQLELPPAPGNWPQIASLQIRHHGNFSYIDATLTDGTALKLRLLRYVGSAS